MTTEPSVATHDRPSVPDTSDKYAELLTERPPSQNPVDVHVATVHTAAVHVAAVHVELVAVQVAAVQVESSIAEQSSALSAAAACAVISSDAPAGAAHVPRTLHACSAWRDEVPAGTDIEHVPSARHTSCAISVVAAVVASLWLHTPSTAHSVPFLPANAWLGEVTAQVPATAHSLSWEQVSATWSATVQSTLWSHVPRVRQCASLVPCTTEHEPSDIHVALCQDEDTQAVVAAVHTPAVHTPVEPEAVVPHGDTSPSATHSCLVLTAALSQNPSARHAASVVAAAASVATCPVDPATAQLPSAAQAAADVAAELMVVVPESVTLQIPVTRQASSVVAAATY